MEALDCLNLLSYKQTNKQITYLGGNSTTEDVHNAIVIEKIPKIPNIPKNPNCLEIHCHSLVYSYTLLISNYIDISL